MKRRIVVAIDSFKGCMDSRPLAEHIARCCTQLNPAISFEITPIADGGEGLTHALTHLAERRVEVVVCDPLMRPTKAHYLTTNGGRTAVMEMASAAGLPLLAPHEYNPLITTTYGVGQIITHALRSGCRELLIGIGGSATNDAGMGMLSALGFRFLDAAGDELDGNGANLVHINSIDTQHIDPQIHEASFEVACDVTNPLFGRLGAAHIYAPQKGADSSMVELLDKGLRNFAEVVERLNGRQIGSMAGAGAAGGLGGGLVALLGANLQRGIDLVLNQIHFDNLLEGASLVITGEGCMDRQTLMGKAPFGVMTRAKQQSIPVVALAGRVDDREMLLGAGFAELFEISPRNKPLEEVMRGEVTLKNIRETICSTKFTRYIL